MWYVYILKSRKYKNYIYIGLTNNIKRRLKEHNSYLSKLSTASYRPLELEAYIGVKKAWLARNLEKYLKTGSGKAILKKRILGQNK